MRGSPHQPLQNHSQAVQFGAIPSSKKRFVFKRNQITTDSQPPVARHRDEQKQVVEINGGYRFNIYPEERSMRLYSLAFALSLISVAILTTGCSSTPNNPTENAAEKPASAAPSQSKEPVLYTGQEAFNRMMGLALKWSADAQPARLESVLTTETTGQNGKPTACLGFFPSPPPRPVKTIASSGTGPPNP